MAFDKDEIKQLKNLLGDQEKTINKNTDKKIKNTVCEALEELVLPRLQKIDDKIENIDDDILDIKDTLEFHGNQLDRIDRRLSAEINRKDDLSIHIENHEKRIHRLESKIAP